MLKKPTALLFVLGFSMSVAGFAQGAAKEARVEGRVVRTSKDKSTLTVPVGESNIEKTVYSDASASGSVSITARRR